MFPLLFSLHILFNLSTVCTSEKLVILLAHELVVHEFHSWERSPKQRASATKSLMHEVSCWLFKEYFYTTQHSSKTILFQFHKVHSQYIVLQFLNLWTWEKISPRNYAWANFCGTCEVSVPVERGFSILQGTFLWTMYNHNTLYLSYLYPCMNIFMSTE